jgi:hypothetical protein
VFLVSGELVKRTAGERWEERWCGAEEVVFFGELQFRYEGSSTHAKTTKYIMRGQYSSLGQTFDPKNLLGCTKNTPPFAVEYIIIYYVVQYTKIVF